MDIIKSIDDFPSTIWNETIEYPALRVPVHATARLRQELKSVLWRHATRGGGRSNIYPDPQQPNEYRILILQKQQEQEQQQQEANHKDGEKEEAGNSNQELIIQQVLEKNKDIDIQKTTFTIEFSYDDFNVERALRKILPVELHAEIPCSFESVGPIAHINLRPPYEPFKFWIGKILLDKNQPRIQTVVTKIGTIDNEYRTFGMQIIAQRQEQQKSPNNDTPSNKSNNKSDNNNNDSNNNDWSIVTVKEEKCTFTLDFQKVYWNSRLAGEHRRMVQEIQNHAIAKRRQQRQQQAAACCSSQSTTAEQQQQQQQDTDTVVVADLMAGVGPFAIPLTAPATVQRKNTSKKSKSPKNNKPMMGESRHEQHQHQTNTNNNIRVYANDLNPDSYKYLKINAQRNKCRDLICSNQDARALLAQLQKDKVVIDHVLMNLPASAPEFLDMFRGYNNNTSPAAALEPQEQEQTKQPVQSSSASSSSCLLPRIHVYCFAPKPVVVSQIQEQTKNACTHDEKSNSSNHDATDFNQSSPSKSGAASNSTANNNDDQHDYQESLDRCANALGIDSLDRERDNVHIHVVRDVSPQKNMICISFQLPFQVTTLPSVPCQSSVVVTKTTNTIDGNATPLDGVQTDQPLRKGLVEDGDDDDKRKRSLDPHAQTTCTESKAAKRSK